MFSVSITFLAYEGLTRNVRVTYAKCMPGVLGASTKFIDFMPSYISGRFLRDLSHKASVSLIIITICAHTLVSISILNIQSTIMNVDLVQTLLLTSCLTAIKAKVIKYCETVYERSEKNMFWPIKNSGEVLSKLKDIGYQATSLSTYDFSTLYTTLPHNLIKEKLLDLIERTFYKKEGEIYLACNDKKAFFTSTDQYKGYQIWSCQNVCETYRFSWTLFLLGLALSYTDKLLVFRWVQIVLHL